MILQGCMVSSKAKPAGQVMPMVSPGCRFRGCLIFLADLSAALAFSGAPKRGKDMNPIPAICRKDFLFIRNFSWVWVLQQCFLFFGLLLSMPDQSAFQSGH